MITSQIEEPITVHTYYDEYLNNIFKYQNCKRNSIFIRYLNININASERDDITDATFDKFNSGIYYDTYDYTPAYLTNQITNTSTNRNDLTGYKFDGELSMVIYTITEPNINDLVLFPYKPHESEHIFRVKTIVTTIKNKIYELTLEYAPIKNLTGLNYLNNYVYLLTQEKNVTSEVYLKIVTLYDSIRSDLAILQPFFNKYHELYFYPFNGSNIAPIQINRQINQYMSSEINNNRYVDNFLKPFGIFNKLPLENIAINISNPRDGYIYLNDEYLPKLTTDLMFSKDPLIFDEFIDYNQFNLDNSVLFNLGQKLGELYAI